MFVANTLFRATVTKPCDDFDDELECNANLLVSDLPISDVQLPRFKLETEKDVLSKIKSYAQNGWPNSRAEVDDYCKPLRNFRDELSVSKGLVF